MILSRVGFQRWLPFLMYVNLKLTTAYLTYVYYRSIGLRGGPSLCSRCVAVQDRIHLPYETHASSLQAFMKNKTEFYITRALIGLCEGGCVLFAGGNSPRHLIRLFCQSFIPGAVLYTSFFYKTGELAIRLSLFWYASLQSLFEPT